MATEKLIKAETLDQYGHEIKDYIDRGDSDLADSISNTDERVADLDERLTDDINNFENRIEKTELKNQDQDLEILELKHLIYETVVDHVEATIEDVDVKPIPDYVDQHKVIDGGEIMLSEILGKTEKWNQKLNRTALSFGGVTVTESNGTYTITGTSSLSGGRLNKQADDFDVVADHKYLFAIDTDSREITWFLSRTSDSVAVFSNDGLSSIYTKPFSARVRFGLNLETGKTYNIKAFISFIDLTDKFGAGNEPTSVDDERIQKLIAKAKVHPEYDAGSLHSVMAEDFKVNGANIYNYENASISNNLQFGSSGTPYGDNSAWVDNNYYEILPSTTYYTNKQVNICVYDENKVFVRQYWYLTGKSFTTPSNARYYRIGCALTDPYTTIYLGRAQSDTYKPYHAPFVLNFLQGNQLKTTESKTLGTLTMTADKGKLTLSGMSMATMVATIGDTLLKAGTYSYRIENPSGDNVGLYDITGDDWLFASSRPVLQGTFTLEQDKTIAMTLDARASTNYGGREIRYMVAKGSELLNEFRQDGVTEPIELNGKGTARDKIIIEQQPDLTFDFVKETAMRKVIANATNVTDYSATSNRALINIPDLLARTEDSSVFIDTLIIADKLPSSSNTRTYNREAGVHRRSVIGSKQIYIGLGDLCENNWASYLAYITENPVTIIYPLATPTRQTLITGLTETQVATLLEKGGTIEVGNEAMTLPDVKVWLEVRKLEA